MQVIKRLPTAEKPNGSVYAVGFRKVYVSNTLGRAVAVVDVDKDEIVTTLRFMGATRILTPTAIGVLVAVQARASARTLTRLRGFEGYDEAKPLILRGADPKGRHYTGVVDATCVAVIFGGACGGRASLSFSNRSCSSGSGWV
jgi:hypothetical protein